MNGLFRFPSALRRHPDVEAWLESQQGELGTLAKHWYSILRGIGPDVRELLHDHYPTVCVGEVAFANVGRFKAHVNVGFYRGVDLPDPARLLQGTGKSMRHVKVRPGDDLDTNALQQLIANAHEDMQSRVAGTTATGSRRPR